MPNNKFVPKRFFKGLLFILMPFASFAQNLQCEAKTLAEFYDCYGGQAAFTSHSVKALTTFIEVEDAIDAGNYTQGKAMLENLFNTYPKGNNIWWNVFNGPNGANIGTPHGYYGLRMMEDIIEFGLHANPNVKARKVKMKIVMVGKSSGIQPTNEVELQNGTGIMVSHTFESKLKEDDYRIIRLTLDLFEKYVKAITKGTLEVELGFVELPNLNLPVKVTTTRPLLAYDNIEPVWSALPQHIKDSTDWWWVLYPSHVPENPTFDDEAFITGGMGADSKGGPVFISDDKWLVRKPAHLGRGWMSDIERRVYLPQWLQHEFFHHLYRIYPELQLEIKGHDWFDINFWPPDFEGQFETDYYSETLHKRLQINCTPLSTRLITRIQENRLEQYSKLSIDELLGYYSLDVIQNPWHEANIILQNGQYYWKNKANVQWEVTPKLVEGKLETGTDSPYPGKDFFIELYQNQAGDFIPGAVALNYQGELYKKRFNLMRASFPIEIALGQHERVPRLTNQHEGELIKVDGKIYWQDNAGNLWLLTPNITDESLGLNTDSPTPGKKFELVLIQNDCETSALGFKYENHYYWKPKRSLNNGSPILNNEISDIELNKDFSSHSIDMTGRFSDPENDSLMFFVTSDHPDLIAATFSNGQLMLNGNEVGIASIYVMVLDDNGGLAVDEFNVNVKQQTANFDIESKIYLSPNITQDFVTVKGTTFNHRITLKSLNISYQVDTAVTGEETKLDLAHLPAGLYIVMVSDANGQLLLVEKVLKM